MSKWIRKGDKIKVIAGNDKGKIGEVLSLKDQRIVVNGINIRKKHMKKTQQTQSAQIVDMEMPIHISNVALISDKEKRVKLKVKIDGKSKQLVYQDGDKEVVFRELKKVK